VLCNHQGGILYLSLSIAELDTCGASLLSTAAAALTGSYNRFGPAGSGTDFAANVTTFVDLHDASCFAGVGGWLYIWCCRSIAIHRLDCAE